MPHNIQTSRLDISEKRAFEKISEALISNEARELIVARIPDSLARVWNSVQEVDKVVGKIRIYKTPVEGNKRAKITVHLDKEVLKEYLNKDKTNQTPATDYRINYIPDKNSNLRVFSYGGADFEFQGKAESICTFQPILNKSYLSYAARRTKSTNRGGPTIKAMTFEDEQAFKKKQKKRVVKVASLDDEVAMDGFEDKMNVLSMQEVRELLFKAFTEKNPSGNIGFWTLKDLQRRTRQPVQVLKDVLKEIAIYHKSGDHARHYEIKQEYKASG
eukprot:augustus_masked-scaffold_8-processed-gene-13.13-mRNA-1 protein AED:1.00 eAED:1.00 QI:0/0/0/0/1/1/2/0/272